MLYYKYPLFLNTYNLNSNEKLVATFLYDFLEKAIYRSQKNNSKEYYLFINQEALGEKLHLSRQTISKVLKKLEEQGLLYKQKIFNSLSYRYYLLNEKKEIYSESNPYKNSKFVKIYDFLFNQEYKALNSGERLLAAFLYDTENLSVQNKFYKDAEQDAHYVIKKQKMLSELFHCSIRSIANYFKKLVSFGLLEYKRIGKTLANHIFCLKNKLLEKFSTKEKEEAVAISKEKATENIEQNRRSPQAFYFNQSDMQNLKSDMQKFNIYKTNIIKQRLNYQIKEGKSSLFKVGFKLRKVENKKNKSLLFKLEENMKQMFSWIKDSWNTLKGQ